MRSQRADFRCQAEQDFQQQLHWGGSSGSRFRRKGNSVCIGCRDRRAEKLSRAFGFIHSVLCWGDNHWSSRLTKWQGHLEVRASEKQAKCHGEVSCRHQQKLAWSSFSSVTFVAQQQASLLSSTAGISPAATSPGSSPALSDRIMSQSLLSPFYHVNA